MPQNNLENKKRHKNCHGDGNLKLRGNIWWARWMFHGVQYERSTKIKEDMVDEHGNRCGRAIAEKVLQGFMAPFKLKNEGDATAVLLKRMEDAYSGAQNIEDNSRMLELKDIAEAFKSSTRRNDITEKRLGFILAIANEFADFAGKNEKANRVTEKIASKWADKIWNDDNLAANTFNSKISAMRQIWRVLGPVIGAQSNPWDGIKKKKSDTNTRRPPTDQELDLIKKSAGNRYGGDILMLILIGENTGMRIGDCSMLSWDDVDFKTNMIRVITEKTGAKVSVPMLPDFRKVLEDRHQLLMTQYKAADKMGWQRFWKTLPAQNEKEREINQVVEKYRNFVCPRMAERHDRNRTLLSALIQRVINNAGIETARKTERGVRLRTIISFHSFRHAFVSKLKMAGVSERAAMELVGHRSQEISDLYTHVNEDFLTSEMQKVWAKKQKK